MLIFTVHEPATPPAALDDRADALVFVKEGFSVPAFLLGPFWLAIQRLWLGLLLYVVGLLLLLGIFQILPGGSGAVAGVLVLASLAFGLEANAIRRWGLERRGYRMLGTAAGKTFEECEHRFLTGWIAGASATGTALGQTRPGPTSLSASAPAVTASL